MKRCPECGNINDDASLFCPRCGRSLADVSSFDMVYTQHVYKPKPLMNKGTVIGAAVVAAILVAAAVGFVFMGLPDDDGFTDKTRTVSWSTPSIDDGNTGFKVTFTVTADEMVKASNSKLPRSGSSSPVSDHSKGVYAVYEYVVVGEAVQSLSQKLWDEFDSKVGLAYKNAKYFADYVLSFVQACAYYELDEDSFGTGEYWMLPVEVLYHGFGDCEDTSILASAIYGCLASIPGPDAFIEGAGVILLPGHAMVGVNISFAKGIHDRYYGTVDTATHDMYYFGETTISDPGEYVYDNPRMTGDSWYYVGAVSNSYSGANAELFTGTSTDYA